jgi:tetratricopeptide (TPR) repeat protein
MLDFLTAWNDGNLEGVYHSAKQTAQYNLVFKYELGWAALRANHLQETIQVMTALEPDKYLFKGRYWWVLTKAYHLLGDYKKELKVAQKGRKKHPELFSTLWNEIRALTAMGQVDEIYVLLKEGLNFPPEPYWNPGYMMLWTANELGVHGYTDESIACAEDANEWFRAHPDSLYLFEQAQAYYISEQLEESREIFEILSIADPENIDYKGYLGVIASKTGNHELSENISQQLSEPSRPYLFGKNVCWQARIAALSGDKDRAIQFLRKAVSQGFDYYSIHEIIDFTSLHDYPPYADLIAPKK